jgi:hypothetical protein
LYASANDATELKMAAWGHGSCSHL